MKFGLIGAGGIGAIRAAALKVSKACDLVAVSDLDEPRARALAPQTRFHATAEALFDDPAVEAVVISTPPQFHEALAVAALDASKHVLIEKPMAPTLEACQRMVEAADRNGRLLTVGFNHRYFDAVKRVREAITSGAIGTLTHVKGFTGHTGLSEFKAGWMYDPAVMGGGALADNGVHMLDLCRYLMGDVAEVYGHSANSVWNLGAAEDNAFALMRSDAGVVGSLHASWSEWKGYRFHIEAYGDRGMARAYYAPMMSTVIQMDQPGGKGRTERNFYPGAIVRERLSGWQSTVIRTFVEEFADFVEAAEGRTGSGRLATGFDGLRAVEVGKAVYASGPSGRAVTLSPRA
ncbi:MAG: Gfo/Idh/MocA family protein [Brevundimonas sp.]